MKNSEYSVKSIIVGLIGLVLITSSSMYVALKLGALPWPTVFVAIVSVTLLRKSDLKEINCTHTLMSAGSMVAGGLAFTLPGLWMTNSSYNLPLVSVIAIAVVGSVLGLFFTTLFRKNFIEVEKLPYPIGVASYNTVVAAKDGKGSGWLFSSMGLSAVFTYIRDKLALIPSVLSIFKGNANVPALSIYVSPMALAIGSIIGPTLAVMWVVGMVVGYFILIPCGLKFGLFSSMAIADIFRSNLGIGLMVGTGLGVAVKSVFSVKKRKVRKLNLKSYLGILTVLVLCALFLVLFTEINILQAVIVVFGAGFACYLSGMLTGQTGINPMEIFGIIVLLLAGFVSRTTLGSSFSIAAVVAVSCGLSGDVMNDLKSGAIIGTSPKRQIVYEAIGALFGSVIAAFVLYVLKDSNFPAPQARAVASMVGGLENPTAFYIGLGIGLLLFLLNVPSATLGLGFYLGTYISVAVGLGALIQALLGKKAKEKSLLVSSGLLGGEGISGVIIALITMFS